MTKLASNSLSDRAETIRTLVAESDTAALTSIDKAIAAGHELIAAKDQCRHGEWLPFLTRAGLHERKAQRLMKLAASGMKSDTVSDFGGIGSALKFLSRRKLPAAGSCLEITASHRGAVTAIGGIWPSVSHPGYFYCAVMRHNGEEQPSNVVWTRRPVSSEPLLLRDGEPAFEPVWHFFETHMGAPASLWEFEEDGAVPGALAYTFDIPYLVNEAEHRKTRPDADSAAVTDFLESAGITPPYRDWGASDRAA